MLEPVRIMNLKAAVEKYLEVVGEFGRPMSLAEFGLSREATEAMVAAWEEDYQLHRHLELILAAGSASASGYVIGELVYTSVVFHPSIRDVFE